MHKKFFLRFLFFNLLFFLFGWVAPSFALVVDPEIHRLQLGLYSEYWFDSQEKAGIAETMKVAADGNFTPLGRKYATFGHTDSPLWYRILLENQSSESLERFLVTGLDDQESQAYLIPGMGGEPVRLQHWHEPDWKIIYRLELPPQSQQWIYLRFKPLPNVTQYRNLQLFNTHGLVIEDRQLHAWGALIYGAFIALALYNLFLFVSLKDPSYFYYICMLFSDMFLLASVDGFGIAYIWSGAVNPDLGYLGGMFLSLFLILFLQRLFHTKTEMPKAHGVLYFMLGVSLFLILATPFSIHAVALITMLYGIGAPIVPLVISILALRTSRRTAILFLIGWSVYLVSIISVSLYLMNQFPLDISLISITYFMKGAALFEMILFSLALADRINLLNREKLQAQRSMVETAEKQAAVLERTVNERTRALVEANLTKDKFFSLISHDLRGPMGNLSIMLNDVIEEPKDLDHELLHGLRQTAGNLYSLLNQLLDWARSQQGKLEIRPEIFPVDQPIEEVVDTLQSQAQQKKITITHSLSPDLFCFADETMIKTVVRNLISNAIKFTYREGEIRIAAWEQEDKVKVIVSDSGVGIPGETLSKLFHVGEKISAEVGTDKEKGSGLGLILCAEFIEKNKGQIGAYSVPEKGSTFWFTLPLAIPTVKEEEQTVVDFTNLTVLLIESEPLDQKTGALALTEMDLNFEVAASQEEGLQLLNKKSFDLVIMDVALSAKEETEELIRLIESKGGSKMIALSRYSKEEIMETYSDPPFHGFINKPLIASELGLALYHFYRTDRQEISSK